MKRKMISLFLTGICTISLLGGCGEKTGEDTSAPKQDARPTPSAKLPENAVDIQLSDTEITVDGETAGNDTSAAVYTANDIVFYLEGQDFTYGEGTEADEHSQAEADEHTVVHITQPGTYRVSGSLSAGQIAVDLGEDAEENPDAVVNLILDNTDITCSVAPAIIFYNVYECGSDDEENATKDVDTSAAGANIYIADGSENNLNGSYVARIYESVELSDDGTEVVDSEKLHKYDGTLYSKMTMNVNGDAENTGVLNIFAENEGLCSDLHLTVNGGNINIESGNDGINASEDYVSVATINDGNINIVVNGSTGEGDGIDSNGWLVINGGRVTAAACSISGDAGIDSDMGIHINGGNVAASGNMLDHISDSEQTFAVFQFNGSQKGGNTYTLKNGNDVVGEWTPANDFSYFIISSPDLPEGTYTFWCGQEQLSGSTSENGMGAMGGGMMRPGGGQMPEDMEIPEGMEMPQGGERPEMPEGMEIPEGMEMPQGGERPEMPEGIEIPEGMEMPQSGERPEMPEDMEMPEGMEIPQGGGRGFSGQGQMVSGEISADFAIVTGANYFIIQ